MGNHHNIKMPDISEQHYERQPVLRKSEMTLGDFGRIAQSFKRSPEREQIASGNNNEQQDLARLRKKKYKHIIMREEVSHTLGFVTTSLELHSFHQVAIFKPYLELRGKSPYSHNENF
jgi:hypothetical protein